MSKLENIMENISFIALVSLRHHTSSREAAKIMTAAWIDAALTVVCKKIAAVHEKANFLHFLVEISLRFGRALNCR